MRIPALVPEVYQNLCMEGGPSFPHWNGGFVEKMERPTPMFESDETRV